MALVAERLINYVDLTNGNLTLADVALISDAYSIKKENENRIQEWARKQH